MVPCFRYTLPEKSISIRLFSRKRKISAGGRRVGGSVFAGFAGMGGAVSAEERRDAAVFEAGGAERAAGGMGGSVSSSRGRKRVVAPSASRDGLTGRSTLSITMA